MMARIALFTSSQLEENGCWNVEKTALLGAVKVLRDKNLLVCWIHLHVRGQRYDSIQWLLSSFISLTSLWPPILDIVEQALCYFEPLIFHSYFPSTQNVGYICWPQAVHVFLPLPPSHVRIGGGFSQNLFGWFCALFAPLFAPFQLHLCHELTISAGYHPNMSSANGIEERHGAQLAETVFQPFGEYVKLKQK